LLAGAPLGLVPWGCTSSDEAPAPADLDASFEASTIDASHESASDAGPLTDSPAPLDVVSPTEAGEAASDADTGVTLASSSTSVTADGSVTLAASSPVGTITSVDFMEGTTVLATVTTGPFELVVPYSYFENGSHTYVANAPVAGSSISSPPVTV